MVAILSTDDVLAADAPRGERDPRPALLASPMSAAQKIGIAVTLLITATDGYDILAASFAAPGLSAEWHLSHAAIGLILAVNLIGLGLGGLFISPLADRIGRRLTILPCLLLIAASMFLAAGAHGAPMMEAMRLLGGFAIGGMVGAALSLATEYANAKNKMLAAAVMSIGLPLGGMIGGASAAVLLGRHGWRSVFVTGGFMTLGVTALAAVLMPESVDFLIGRGGARSLQALNDVLRRFGRPSLAALSPAHREVLGRPAGRQGLAIFSGRLRATTLAMSVINFAQMMTIFYFISWLPQIVTDLKFTPSAAATVSIFQNLFGVFGALAVGWMARRLPITPLAVITMAGTGLAIMLFAVLPPVMPLLKIGAAFEGFMALGCSAAIYGLMAQAFPAAARSSGTGFAYALGRLGSIVAAVVPGLLFTHGLGLLAVAAVMSVGCLAAIAALLTWNTKGGPRAWTKTLPEVL